MTNEDGTTTLDNEWQDLKSNITLNEARVSDARDYELQRMKVVAYSRFIDNPPIINPNLLAIVFYTLLY